MCEERLPLGATKHSAAYLLHTGYPNFQLTHPLKNFIKLYTPHIFESTIWKFDPINFAKNIISGVLKYWHLK